jgi:hypothetical protein
MLHNLRIDWADDYWGEIDPRFDGAQRVAPLRKTRQSSLNPDTFVTLETAQTPRIRLCRLGIRRRILRPIFRGA